MLSCPCRVPRHHLLKPHQTTALPSRVGRLVFGSWARYTKVQRLGAARERAAQMLSAAEEVRRSAALRESEHHRVLSEHDSTVAESIAAMRQEALVRQAQIDDHVREIELLKRQLQNERRITEEAIEAQQTLEERASGVQRRAAFRLFSLYGKNAAGVTFHAWKGLIREKHALKKANREAQELSNSLEEYELQVMELEVKALSQQDKMSRRILQQLVGSLLARCFAAWARCCSTKAKRRAAEEEQEALMKQLADSAEDQEAKEARKKEAMARRLLKGNVQRQTLMVFGAWRAWTANEARLRERASIEDRLAEAEEKAEALRLEESLKGDATKEKIAKRVGKMLWQGQLRQIFHAWAEETQGSHAARKMHALIAARDDQKAEFDLVMQRQIDAKGKLVRRAFCAMQAQLIARVFGAWKGLSRSHGERRRSFSAQEVEAERADRAEKQLEILGEELVRLKMERDQTSETIKAKLAAKLGRTSNLSRMMKTWIELAAEGKRSVAAADRADLERRIEAEKERKAIAYAARGLLGGRARCFVAWRGEWTRVKLEKAEADLLRNPPAEGSRASTQMENLLARMKREKLGHLLARQFHAWRSLTGSGKASKLAGSNAQAQLDNESLAGQLRLASAAREAEARRAEMVKSEAKLEMQARVSQLEAALRRAEVDAADAVRKAELRAEEHRMSEGRQMQLQLTELQSQLKLERLERDKAADRIRAQMHKEHEIERKELERLRRLAGVSADDSKQITRLQMQLVELQDELRHAQQDPAAGRRRGSTEGDGWFGGLFGSGGGSSSPDGLSRRSGGGTGRAELGFELEAKTAEAASLSVQLSNLKAALATKETELSKLRR